MSIAELPQHQLQPDSLGSGAYSLETDGRAGIDEHSTSPYWAQRFTEDPDAARAAWLEQEGRLPVSEDILDPVAIYQQAFAQSRANRIGWRVWRRRNPNTPDQEVMDMLTTSAASLSILQEAVTIDETAVTE